MVFHPDSAGASQPNCVPSKVSALLGVLVGAVLLSACMGLAPRAASLPTPKQTGEVSATPFAARSTSAADVVASGNESLVYASDRAGNGDIFVAQPGRPPANLTAHPAGDWDPVWSPACGDPSKACRIAFTSHRSGDSEIWIMDKYGRNLINVTQHPAWDYWPDWSPDDQAIVFVSERDGDQDLYIQAVHGGRAVQLTFNDESDRLPAWSPDGTRIAFAAVRDDVEAIHLIGVNGDHEWSLTQWPLRATSPAWSPDARRIAFVGWDHRDRPGIYVMDIDAHIPQLLWEGTAWIGSLAWSCESSADSRDGWLLFTSWQDRNHELYALSPEGGQPVRVTRSLAWDDFADLRTGLAVRPDAWLTDGPVPTVADASVAGPEDADEFAYGVNIADLGKAYLVRDLGFGWAKGYVNWETVERKRGRYRWDDPDNTVSALQSQGLRILLRVHGSPGWARPSDAFLSYPPDDMVDFAHFVSELAGRYRGQVAAYEIWNEPNLNYEWGYLSPDPARYTEMLKAAYQAVKMVDPAALIVSGGLATTGDGSPTAVGDLDYLQGMYDAGARGYFDAFGSHPYAFGHAPDYQDAWGLSLSRVTAQRQVMVANGDEATPVWITELGWVLHTNWNLVEHEAIGVDELQQAHYLVWAYQKARSEWPWVHAMFLFNLDFGSVPWYTAAEPMRWYAILNPDRTPRPAYSNIKSQISHN
jgi:polysaccharide biosynthesis protein PslG